MTYTRRRIWSHILVELGTYAAIQCLDGRHARPICRNRYWNGAGIATLKNQFIPRSFMSHRTSIHYLHYLRSYSVGKPMSA